MKTRYSKLLFIGLLLVSLCSFIYLNTIGAASTGVAAGFSPDSLFQLPDAKVTKLILDQLQLIF